MLLDFLSEVADRRPNDNLRSIEAGIIKGAGTIGLMRPCRLVPYVAQVMHESARGRYDREVWGPSAAQVRYDTRTDLGNSAAADGDGFKYRGRTAIQITGKRNFRLFRDWCRSEIDPDAPDFVANPDAVNADPWEGLGPLWYWATNSLNRYADRGDMEMLTRRINGGLNGFQDRLDLYTVGGLIGLEFATVREFQASAGIQSDGISGPQTRAKIHEALAAREVLPFLARSQPVNPPQGEGAPLPSPLNMVEISNSFLAMEAEIQNLKKELHL